MEPVPLNNFPPPLASHMNHHDARMMHRAVQPVPVVWPSRDRLFPPAFHIDHHLNDGAHCAAPRIWLMRPALQPLPAVFKSAVGATRAVRVCAVRVRRFAAAPAGATARRRMRRPVPAVRPRARCGAHARGAVRIWMTRRIGMRCELFRQRGRSRVGPALALPRRVRTGTRLRRPWKCLIEFMCRGATV